MIEIVDRDGALAQALTAAMTAGLAELTAAVDRLTAAALALAPAPPPVQPVSPPPPVPAVTVFAQRDPAWASQVLGVGAQTIGEAGCLLTAVASCLCDLGIATDPGRLNAWLLGHSGFEGNLLAWYALGQLGAQIVELVACPDPLPAPVAKLRQYLAAGLAVVVKVDAQPGGDLQPHWLRLLSVDEDGKDGTIMDPWTGTLGRLSEHYEAAGWDVSRVILAAGVLGRRG